MLSKVFVELRFMTVRTNQLLYISFTGTAINHPLEKNYQEIKIK
jgi:hypothetical protein